MKLYCLVGSPRISACAMALDKAGVQYEKVWLDFSEFKTEKLLKFNPQGKVPTLETPEGGVYETTAILRHVVRLTGKLGGSTPYEQAQVDQWLAWTDAEIASMAASVIVQLYGLAGPGSKHFDLAHLKTTLLTKLGHLNNCLQGKKYVVGNDVTVADYALLNYIYPLFVFTFGEKDRQTIPNVLAWIENLATQQEFKTYFGKVRLCQEPFKAPKIEAAKPAPAAAKPKEEKPKAAAAPKEEDYEDPKPKEPVFPETALNLMTFKTDFINEKDMDKALANFWSQYKEGEWSLWHLKYLKYPGECEVVFRTNNLLRTFFSRLEHIKKYLFGTHFILGDEPNLEIEGLWLVRGPTLFDQITEIDVYDTYKWTKLDGAAPETHALVKDFWTHRKEDEEQVQGKTIRTFKWIK